MPSGGINNILWEPAGFTRITPPGHSSLAWRGAGGCKNGSRRTTGDVIFSVGSAALGLVLCILGSRFKREFLLTWQVRHDKHGLDVPSQTQEGGRAAQGQSSPVINAVLKGRAVLFLSCCLSNHLMTLFHFTGMFRT